MKEVLRIKVQNYCDRQDIVRALVNSGYAIKVVEIKEDKILYKTNYFVVIYGEEGRE